MVRRRLVEPGDELRVLNRVLWRTGDGYEFEADQRHTELLVATLAWNSTHAHGQTQAASELPRIGCAHKLPGERRARYRVCGEGAVPQHGVANPARHRGRLAQYLLGRPRVVIHFGWQAAPSELFVYTGSDWARCARTCKSTSGGAALRGCHDSRTWRTTQATVTLSSAEAELIALVQGRSEGLAVQSLMTDFGEECGLIVGVDPSTAVGICKRTAFCGFRNAFEVAPF